MTHGPVVAPDALAAAYRHCERLVRDHYENFAVGSRLLPRRLRRHVAALYAFVRTADDLADEGAVPVATRLERLNAFESVLDDAYAGRADDAAFVALADTVATFGIPIDPFRQLLDAFRLDADWHPFQSDADLLAYCRRTADPVGHLLLYLFGHRDADRRALSDRICTGLQLSNFLQDLGADVARGRLYLPFETLRAHGCDPVAVARGEDSPRLRRCIRAEVDRARRLLLEGRALVDRLDRRLGCEIDMFIASGLAILGKIAATDCGVMVARPTLPWRQKVRILLGAVGPLVRMRPARPETPGSAATLRAAQEYCHDLTVRSGSSFAYAFRLLPPGRRAALEAVYAFCRFVDDVADDDGCRTSALLLERWRGELARVYDGTSAHPIGVALSDAVRRFALDRRHFNDLIDGVAMDLSPRRYATFEDLFQYCYRVASTVGLLCIEIFGYRNPTARAYATDLGVAFQLTNILRDVVEDGHRGRIYLPLEDLARFGVDEQALLAGRYSPSLGALLAFEGGRARAYYLRSEGALASEDRGSLAAAEAMRRIYTRLLDRIEARKFDVFGARVTLPRYEKMTLALASWGRARLSAMGIMRCAATGAGPAQRAGGFGCDRPR